MRQPKSKAGLSVGREQVLRGVYVGRMALVASILAAALVSWRAAEPTQTLVATVAFLAALGLTGGSYWHVRIRRRPPTDNFTYLQVLFDAFLVTAVVHITGGPESPFAFLYILVISAGALLLPLPGGILVGVLATILFFADAMWSTGGEAGLQVLLQAGLFGTVALLTGWLGGRLRKAGLALGEMESALRRLRLDTGDILANIATGVLTVDGEGRLVYLNPAGERILGLSAEAYRGSEVIQAVERVAPGMGEVLRSSLATGAPVARFKTTSSRNGAEAVLGISTTVLKAEAGTAPSVTAIFQDITDQERLSALNRRNERLEAIAELSASLAHEIKNPLASIRSAVEQLSRGKLKENDARLLQGLVLTESDRLSRLLTEFIEFSAMKMGASEEVDLASLARDCAALVAQHPEIGSDVRFDLAGVEAPVRVPGDRDLLHRAVFNLVLNAAQFAGPGGKVRVELRGPDECPPRLETRRVPHPVCLSVSDSGPGVEPEDLPRIFDPFFTHRPGGSGLGLAVVHRAVEAHEGAVLVDRAEEGGARFSLYLPGARGSAADQTPPKEVGS